jgi:EPS-associated MarR family transcriptional regulator
MTSSTSEEARYKILRYLEENPEATQRELARELGMSLGKVNYCIQALVEKGLIKIQSFRKSPNKLAYVYVLTSAGIQEKINLTYAFLKRKVEEYDLLKSEIRRLRGDVSKFIVQRKT